MATMIRCPCGCIARPGRRVLIASAVAVTSLLPWAFPARAQTAPDPALIDDLRHVRRNGYALDREEYTPGVICVGAAIRDHNGAVVGAISASAPTMRTTEDHLALMREEVVAAARALSAELGGFDVAERALAG